MTDKVNPYAWRDALGVLKDTLPDVPSEELIRRVRSDEPIWQGDERAELAARLERERNQPMTDTTALTARERIADALDSFRMIADVEVRNGAEPMDVATRGAEEIIAIVKEAMLGEAVLRESMRLTVRDKVRHYEFLLTPQHDAGDEVFANECAENEYPGFLDDLVSDVSAALTAAFGEEAGG